MEHWKEEIKRLDKIRLDLGLNWNRMEKLTGVNRGQIKKMFEFTNIPSMELYFDVKIALENEFEVVFSEVQIDKPKSSIVAITSKTVVANVSVKKETASKIVAVQKNQKEIPKYEEKYQFQNNCDCHLVGSLFIRGKSGCKKTREEHKF
jgi:hypothetical protein